MSKHLSKFLSLVLRHQPDKIGIVLDDAGWTDVDALLAACAKAGTPITRTQLDDIVKSSDKQRFALSPDGTRIRANQGHSVDVDLALEPVAPPAILFHGTVDKFLDSIRATGLSKGARHHVHLSADTTTASKVGERRGKPVLLRVRAEAMAAAGHTFFRSANGVWLTDAVPPEFIEFPDTPSPSDRLSDLSRGAKSELARTTLTACETGAYTNAKGERVEIADAVAAARAGTELHQLGDSFRAPSRGETTITVTGETTLQALSRLAARKRSATPVAHTGSATPVAQTPHLGCLNFASAKNPGGGFLGGAQAQEESLARSSALYPCLLERREHYERNRATALPIYLDLAIWSPRVPFFKTDRGDWLDAPVLASVITCAAPNASALRQQNKFDAAQVERALRLRAVLVLAIAAHHHVDQLVLGAWGAGVFGNDPVMVADAFGTLLEGEFAGAFPEVIFAVPGDGPNHDAFAKRFG
jgi:putative RNA 2'-phosphotransferase